MLILCGETCAGKDKIVSELEKLGLEKLITYTTRPMRDGEINGKTYHFISEEEFWNKKDNGFFAETTSYETVYGRWYYGSAKEDYQKDKVMIANPDGVEIIREHKELSPVIFMIDVPEADIRQRLINRGDNPDEAARRLESDWRDFKNIQTDYKVQNPNGINPEEVAKTIYHLYTGGIQNEVC